MPTARGADEVSETIETVPLADAMAMIVAGDIRDAKTIAALVQAHLRAGGERRA